MPSTTLSVSESKMTNKVYYRRLHQLINQLKAHPHRKEILELAYEQLQDDHDVIETEDVLQ